MPPLTRSVGTISATPVSITEAIAEAASASQMAIASRGARSGQADRASAGAPAASSSDRGAYRLRGSALSSRIEDGRGNDRTLPGQSLVIAVRDLRPCAA